MVELERRTTVLFYSHSPEVSGAEISLLLTIKHMPESIESILAAPNGELINRAKAAGISVIPVKSYRARMSNSILVTTVGIIGSFGAAVRLSQVIKRVKPRIVHANSIRAAVIASVAVSRLHVKLVWHIRDNLPKNLLGQTIRQLAVQKADRILAISNAIREYFSTSLKLKDKTTVVYNGIDDALKGKSIRSEFGLPDNIFVVGVVGQIASWKRQIDAVNSFAEHHRLFPCGELWIVGEPKFRSENLKYYDCLMRRVQYLGIESSVRFLGFRSDVMNIMESLDVLLVPSENEPFGRVIIEGMLAGKPVIGTNGGGIPEIIVDGQTGFLVDIGDVQGMVKHMNELRLDIVLRRTMGRAGAQRVSEVFAIKRTCQQIELAYSG